jgi:hypothetical protein
MVFDTGKFGLSERLAGELRDRTTYWSLKKQTG